MWTPPAYFPGRRKSVKESNNDWYFVWTNLRLPSKNARGVHVFPCLPDVFHQNTWVFQRLPKPIHCCAADLHMMQLMTILHTNQTVVGRISASGIYHPRKCYCKTHYHARVSKVIDPFPPTAMLNQKLLCRLAIFLPIKRPPQVCNPIKW